MVKIEKSKPMEYFVREVIRLKLLNKKKMRTIKKLKERVAFLNRKYINLNNKVLGSIKNENTPE